MTAGKWRKSSRSSSAGGQCVETRTANSAIAPVEVRDSKAPEIGSLAVPRSEFAALLRAIG